VIGYLVQYTLSTNAMKIIIRLLFVLVIVSACKKPAEQATSGIVTEKIKARLDSTLRSFVDSSKVIGVSALIFEDNKEVYFNAFGLADRERNIPMDRKTLVRIFSMTKPVTGSSLMKLYEQGVFQLDDPLSKYAPEFADMKVFKGVDKAGKMILEPVKRPITIRDITRHTAGFASGGDTSALGKMWREVNPTNRENTLAEMAKKLGSIPLAFHPGEEWAYGVSVDVQAFMVERISGKPYHEFVRENILDPLGMSETRYVVPPDDTTRFAAMYRRSEDGQFTRVAADEANSNYFKKWPLTTGGSGLTSSVDNYQRFARMLVNEGTLDGVTILKPETVRLMATNHLSDSVTERMWLPSKGQVGFGIDFAVRLREPASKDENYGIVGEFFWDGAASTLFWVDPKNKLTAVLFVQLLPYDKVQLHKKFRDAVYGQ
jgi:CubicO group peptidase (beta-lactamase class C family)